MKTLWGRRRQIPELRARNYQVRTLGERLAVNTVIQGTAADIIKLAMVRCHRALAESRLQTRLLLTIHDELLFEGPPAETDAARELIEREMVGVWERATRRWRSTSAWAGTGWRRSERTGGAGMSRGLAVLVGVGAGCLVGMQAPINSRLGKTVGSLQAASFSFLVGTAALLLIRRSCAAGSAASASVGQAPWWALVGGLLGAVYVTVALIAVRTLGASGLTAVVITGQLAISVVIDRFGLLGVARQPIGAQRVLGLVLLVAGVVLVVRR